MSNNSNVSIFTIAFTSPCHILITVLNVILVLLITVGNILTLCAITKFRNLRHQSNVMIGALALADLFMGLVRTPVLLLNTHMPLLFKLRIPCLTYMFITHFGALSAITFLSLLSLERLVAIQFPFYYHAHSSFKVAIIFNIAVLAVGTSTLIPLVAGTANWYDGVNCYAPTLYPGYYTRILIALGLMPLFVGFGAFIRVVYLAFKSRKQIFDESLSSLRKQESVRTKLMLTAYIISLCFWMPHLIYYTYDTVSKADRSEYLFRLMALLDLGSSAINCFLYAWKHSKFRAAYKELLCLNSCTDV